MHSIWNLNYSLPKEIPIDFHNGYNYDHCFIIKVLAEEFEKNTCLRENNDKYITFTVPIEKEVTKNDKNGEPRNDKNGEEITSNISYISQFLIASDLWQVLYQILSIIFLKEFIKLNVTTDTMMQNM